MNMKNVSTVGRYIANIIVIVSMFSSASATGLEKESCKTVTFSDVGWTDITATTTTASLILKTLGYNVKTEFLSVPVTYNSLANGDVDIFLGNWMPTMSKDITPYIACYDK